MAAIRATWATPLFQLPARAFPSLTALHSPPSYRLLQFISHPLRSSPDAYVPHAIIFSLPSILSELWESILRAVPKKKTPYTAKRHRQMAGKALKDVKSVTNCPGCGQPKRAHLLCPTCVSEVKRHWREEEKAAVST
ncbi:Ski complex subunit Rec14 [Emydomyces testavorans]|uniref:Large ribosomal subunit protein bL32m n=1 Tax=Emydomyces testavorans TaxID=2070801 RepID=A0AAF0DCR3_9EURO|nr:Ski complex subunit Rec14 [Emydomyces testavorans]